MAHVHSDTDAARIVVAEMEMVVVAHYEVGCM